MKTFSGDVRVFAIRMYIFTRLHRAFKHTGPLVENVTRNKRMRGCVSSVDSSIKTPKLLLTGTSISSTVIYSICSLTCYSRYANNCNGVARISLWIIQTLVEVYTYYWLAWRMTYVSDVRDGRNYNGGYIREFRSWDLAMETANV